MHNDVKAGQHAKTDQIHHIEAEFPSLPDQMGYGGCAMSRNAK